MSENQKQIDQQEQVTAPAVAERTVTPEDLQNRVILTRDPNFKRIYCDCIQMISYFHGNIKFTLGSMAPKEEGQPTNVQLIGELILPLRDFLSAVQDEVSFLNRLKASGLIREEGAAPSPEPEQAKEANS